MKTTKRLILLCLFGMVSTWASANDFGVGGIYYNITSSTDLTCSVTYVNTSYNSYSGIVTIPSSVSNNGKTYSVTSIGREAFSNCSNLASVTIPNSVTSIGNHAFSHCSSLTSVTIPGSVARIGNNAFYGCSGLASVTIPGSVISIGGYAFYGCNSLPVFGNIRYADTYAIEAVDKTQSTYTIKDGTKWIGDEVFSGCSSLTSVTIPGSVTSIGIYAFSRCSSLTSVTIPGSVTSIRDFAFSNCSSLASVTIPGSVTSIAPFAFSGCSSLTSVVSLSQEPFHFETSVFNQIADNCVLIVPAGTREAYIAQGWSENIFGGGIVEMTPQDITVVDGAAFENDEEGFYDEINYNRTFNNTNWQSLYVPFEIPITEELLEEFEFAYINAARQYDYDDDGEIDNLTIEIFKVKSGTLRANHPYLIRAKVAGEKTITVNEATLYATEENSIDCSTTALKFTFTGGYQTLNYDDIGGCYLLGGGTWNEVKEGGTMKPMRFYLKIESRGNGQVIPASAAANPIRMTVFGEDDEVTVVQSPLLQEGAGEAPVFDLQGRRVEYPENGIYIINGKKVIVK